MMRHKVLIELICTRPEQTIKGKKKIIRPEDNLQAYPDNPQDRPEDYQAYPLLRGGQIREELSIALGT
jgi:hypothetical protein